MFRRTQSFRRISLVCQQLETRLNPSNMPLPDLGGGYYQGFQGGLYPNGSNTPPVGHRADGLSIAVNQIRPLDNSGQVDVANGKIVMVSVGMSNTTQEFGSTANSFKVRADSDNSKNPRLVIVDGAQGGQAANAWVDPNAPTWATLGQRLTNAGVTAQQVEVAWIKQADVQPNQFGAFPLHAQHLQIELESIVQNLKTLFPNIRIAYVSSRTMSYDNTATHLNPEPFAYEAGFATQWLIGKQIAGDAALNYDPSAGPVTAPYLSWGPYLWVDGATPRSDGLTWLTSDLQSDLTHPSPNGVLKVSDQLLSFFKTEPTAAPWFSRSSVVGQPPTANPLANVAVGIAPLTVQFDAQAQDADGTIRETNWTFDDGTFSKSATPTKTFLNPGAYTVHLAVVDDSGNTVTRAVTIQVNAAAPITAGVQISGGADQRSMITGLSVAFSEMPTFPDGIAAAIQLWRTGAGGPTGAVNLSFATSGNTVNVAFSDPVYAPFGGSLADGKYALTLVAGKIQGANGGLDGNGDGISGDNQVTSFHRLFGDADGNGLIDLADFAAFRAAFGAASSIFSFDGSGNVDLEDFSQFRIRFGRGA